MSKKFSLDLESVASSSSSDDPMPPPRVLGGANTLNTSNTSNSSGSKGFWKTQGTKFKETVMVGGTFYNTIMACVVVFVGVFLVLVVLQPPMVITTPPKDEKTGKTPPPCLSWVSVLVWSAIAAAIVLGITFFARGKKSPNYVVESSGP